MERAYNDFWWDYGSNITEDQRTSLVIDPPDGKIPWTPEAQDRMARLFETYFGTVAAGPEDRGLAERCILGLTPGHRWYRARTTTTYSCSRHLTPW